MSDELVYADDIDDILDDLFYEVRGELEKDHLIKTRERLVALMDKAYSFQPVSNSYKFEDPTLPKIVKALGWDGGTVHQALDEIKMIKTRVEILEGAYRTCHDRAEAEKSLADELAAALEECLDDSRHELHTLIHQGMETYRPYVVTNQRVQIEEAERALSKYKEMRGK